MSAGENIRKRRLELRMSQQELADAMGYKTRSTIAKIESGENDVTQSKLRRFAQVMDTTVEYLLTGGVAMMDAAPVSADIIPAPVVRENGRTVAVILAGGKSSRNQQNIPNQFINIMGKPVIVLRDVTERPEGVEAGGLLLSGTGEEAVVSACRALLTDDELYGRMAAAVNPYGDGHASERIAEILLREAEKIKGEEHGSEGTIG